MKQPFFIANKLYFDLFLLVLKSVTFLSFVVFFLSELSVQAQRVSELVILRCINKK